MPLIDKTLPVTTRNKKPKRSKKNAMEVLDAPGNQLNMQGHQNNIASPTYSTPVMFFHIQTGVKLNKVFFPHCCCEAHSLRWGFAR